MKSQAMQKRSGRISTIVVRRYITVVRLLIVWLFIGTASVAAQLTREPLENAWWTGPLLAPSAATLPHGHFLIEPYLYDVTVQGQYDGNGAKHSARHANGFRSLTYILYGLTDKWTVGMIPTGGYNVVGNGFNSSAPQPGDLTLQAEYRLKQFHEGGWSPMMSVALQETLPTGKYDRLGVRPSDGLGSGAYSTTLALYSQTYFWLPNHRILRARFNVSQSVSDSVTLQDVSVYGTSAGFRGHAKPGASTFVDAAAEYSLTRKWVFALDATYRHNGNTRVAGFNLLDASVPSMQLDSGSSEAFGLAPAIEYNWKHNMGVIVGTYLIAAGRNTAATITPAIAINYVH